jgi:hypothetical protein
MPKEELYEGVKTLVESDVNHIHLSQQKLYTLFSIAFQYLLFKSTKEPGAYLIRIEDSILADKLAKKSKDASTRKFLQSLLIPRKLTYGKSTFYLDSFHIGSWSLTSDIPKTKLKAALICKNTSAKPMTELDENDEEENPHINLPEDYYLSSLTDFMPKTVTIAYDHDFDGLQKIEFPFIKKEPERMSGFTISSEVNLDDLED